MTHLIRGNGKGMQRGANLLPLSQIFHLLSLPRGKPITSDWQKEMSNTRILIQHPHGPGEISGVLTYVNFLAESLGNDLGCEVTVISSKETSRAQRLRAVFRNDVVHLNSGDIWLLLASKLLRKRSILKLHYLTYQSLHFEYVPMPVQVRIIKEIQFLWHTYGKNKQRRIFVEASARLVIRIAVMLGVDRLAACSNFLAESTGFPAVVTVYNPAQITSAATLPSNAVPPAAGRETNICFVGRLSFDKGCDLLLDAIALLAIPNLRVQIIGAGEEHESLKMQVERLGLNDVHFMGQCSSSEVATVLQSARVLVVPSRWQEPAGYTPVEAALNGCPVIAASVGGLPETAGPHALYFDRESVAELASHLLYAINNPAAMEELGQLSQSYVEEKFAPAKTAAEFLKAAGI